MITQSELKELLHYSVITGQFYWLKSSGRAKEGYCAGNLGNDGYRRIILKKGRYLAHRLAWFYITGKWPANDIDHKNGNRDVNCWLNLRLAFRFENMMNIGKHKDNKSGFKGVSWAATNKKWKAQITINGVYKHLGYFPEKEFAYSAYQKAAKELQKEFQHCKVYGISAL